MSDPVEHPTLDPVTTGTPGQDSTPDSTAAAAPEQPPQGSQEDTFFDPSTLPDELKAGWKQLQGSYTKKMQEISQHKRKVEAFDAFMANPLESIRQVAAQYGLTVAQAQQMQQQAQAQQGGQSQQWEPQTWDEVLQRAKDEARQAVMAELGPVIQTVQQSRAKGIEQQLTSIDPEWRTYETEMADLVRRHPTLASDPAQLYRLAVPTEISEGKAIQQALKRFEAKQSGSRISGKSEVGKASPNMPDITKLSNQDAFQQAVEAARLQINKPENKGVDTCLP